VRSTLGDQSEISNVDGSGQTALVGSIKDGIERDVLKDLVDPQLVRIEDHFDGKTERVEDNATWEESLGEVVWYQQ
jgi:hypothetical protein